MILHGMWADGKVLTPTSGSGGRELTFGFLFFVFIHFLFLFPSFISFLYLHYPPIFIFWRSRQLEHTV